MKPLPVIDLALPASEVAENVRLACRQFGFFHVINHGIHDDMLAKLFEECEKFFSLPDSEKAKIMTDQNNRGYTPYKEETLDPKNQTSGDTKEGLYFGREVAPNDPEADKPLHGLNQWPDHESLPLFHDAVMQYFEACTKLGFRLLDAISDSLGLPHSFFRDKFDPPMVFLRPLRYGPELSQPAAGLLGAGAHTDYGMLTILATDTSPGLQVLMGQEWVPIDYMPGALVINLGDLLERWTNGMYKSAMHRVVSTCGKPRLSAPFFFEPNFDALVECLPGCSEGTPRYPPITAGKYLLNQYNSTHELFQADLNET